MTLEVQLDKEFTEVFEEASRENNQDCRISETGYRLDKHRISLNHPTTKQKTRSPQIPKDSLFPI